MKMSTNAVPTIFPLQPSYLNSSPAPLREGVKRRDEALKLRDSKMLNELLNNDCIRNFEHFKQDFVSRGYLKKLDGSEKLRHSAFHEG